jgi:hypothetical protein
MADFTKTIDINASPARVWSVMRDGERWNEWTASVTSIRLLDPKPTRVGHRALIRQPKFPPALWTITELNEGSDFTWVSRAPGVRVVARHSVEPVAGGTRATLSLTYHGFVAKIIARLTRAITLSYLDMEAEGLKARSESSIPH